jgi:uncharacterized membrane protein
MSSMKQVRAVAGLVGLGFGAVGAVKELREAKGKRDYLALANAIVNIIAVITGGALAIRGLRKGDDAE